MDSRWGTERAVEMLSGFARWFRSDDSAAFRNHFVIRDLEALALIAGESEVAEFAASLIGSLPDDAFTGGVISNIGDLSSLIRREPATIRAAEARFPLYTDEVTAKISSQTDPHLRPIFDGQTDLARARASTPLELEEVASACAIAGRFDEAFDAMQCNEFESSRKIGTRVVLCVESYRADRLDLTARLIAVHFSKPGHFPLGVAAGLLGRVPWAGYPYPDY